MPAQSANEGGSDNEEGTYRPRKRQAVISKACEHCKVKKARCDSSRPQCGMCQRKGVVCEYKEKGQPGLRPGYGKAVEQRLSLLEDNMENMSRTVQEILSCVQNYQKDPIQTQPLEAQLSALGTSPDPTRTTSDREQQQTGPSDGEPLWQPVSASLPTTASTATATDLNIFAASPLLERIDPRPPLESWDVTNTPTVTTADSSLPPEPIIRELVDLFFEHVYPWAPLLHRPSFLSKAFSSEQQVVLHGIVVVAYRFWRKATPPAEVRGAQIKTSREQILLRSIDVASLASTQALALLAIDAIGQGPGPRTWNIMAMLVTSTRQLRLASTNNTGLDPRSSSLVDNDAPDKGQGGDDMSISGSSSDIHSNVEEEQKHRLFWTIYALDRFSSVPLGQPGSIDSRLIKLPYPVRDGEWGQNVVPEWFQRPSPARPYLDHRKPVNLWHYYIDVLTMVDQSNQLLIQPVNLALPASCEEWQSSFRRFDISLFTWFENLPWEAREPPANFEPIWTLVHATFYLINIRMYTVAAFPSTASPYLKPSTSARSRCRQAVRSVASLAASLESHQIQQLGPTFPFVVWVAARSLVMLWTMGYETARGAVPDDLEALLHTLRQSAIHWSCSQRYSDMVQLIVDTKNSPSGPVGLEIFNDTRRTAYGLQNRLGALVDCQAMALFAGSDDFLDVGFSDLLNFSGPQVGLRGAGREFDADWL
ncbi:Citrinin biosynthesis transcriptional activator ctnR [Colletotrichum siamense]|nr:Citrinin biosynthesis transcriptional activator ctnR [Colletotrichum siamense]KAF4871312.1 Citrinin biosynthesis transcriptional activator ctnR [Colletotrichum siamense]